MKEHDFKRSKDVQRYCNKGLVDASIRERSYFGFNSKLELYKIVNVLHMSSQENATLIFLNRIRFLQRDKHEWKELRT